MFKIGLTPRIQKFEIICNNTFIKYKFFINPLRRLFINLHSAFVLIGGIVLFETLIFYQKLSQFELKTLRNLLLLLKNLTSFSFKVFKAYGINMRVIRLKKRMHKNILFLRLGYSHGFLIKLSNLLFFRVFKRRYFLLAGNDFAYIQNLSYHLRNLRFFFQYKLIGIKTVRDTVKIKVGKKKSF